LSLGFPIALATADTQGSKPPRIGFVSIRAPAASPYVDGLRQGLRELGYIEDQSIRVEWRFAGDRFDRLPGMAAELVELRVDVIVADGTPAAVAAQKATNAIPIVMAGVADPVAAGLVQSLGRPGGNVTGLTMLSPDVSAKRLQLLKETVPKLSHVAMLWNPTHPASPPQVKEAEIAARQLGLQLHRVAVRDAADLENAFAAMSKAGATALLVADDAMLGNNAGRIAALAAQRRLPAIYGWRDFVEAGGLMAYGPSLHDQYRRAATYVQKILRGAKPAELPVEQPTTFELVVNLRTATALGLNIPQAVLLRADEVIR
jgi:putative ABC transport system substrate-binding protein